MLVVVSPAKKLDWSPVDQDTTDPVFQRDATRLAGVAAELTTAELRKLMGISETLAELNQKRFCGFASDPAAGVTRPAAFAFAGDTYQGLEAKSLEPDALDWAQRHLRILSGLYGVLRPLDRIQPYRLEMGSRLKTGAARSLYGYWGRRIAEALNADAQASGSSILVNCASKEYFSAVDRDVLAPRVVTPLFLEMRSGETKTISFYAKKARGAMARFVVERRIGDIDGLRDFDTGGYRFDPGRSSVDRPVFIRQAVQSETVAA